MIESLNRRILIKRYVFGQDSDGNNIKALSDSWTVWANVKQKNGSRSLDNNQVQYQEIYEITKRYEPSRVLFLTDEIVYENSILSIHSIKEDSEGRKKFNIIEAYSTGSNISSNSDINFVVTGLVHYVATGGEISFHDNDLIGASLILVFRDGVNYSPITTGTPTNKQALLNSTDGTITFSNGINPMQAGEVTDVYILK